MAAQRIPGPEGVGAYPQSVVDDGTLVRTSTATPGLGGMLGDTWQINSALSMDETRAMNILIGFCREMEDTQLAADLQSAVNDEALDFGEVEDGSHAAWDPITDTIMINQNILTEIVYPKNLDGRFRDLIGVVALLAHELKHHRDGRLTWVLDPFTDSNRMTDAHWAGYGAWGLMWNRPDTPTIKLATLKTANWTLGSVNRYELSVWQVGLQKRLEWAQHEYQRLKQLQKVKASRAEQIGVARRVQVICDDFMIYHNEALSLSNQMMQLKLTTTGGKEIPAVNARQEIERYASEATRIIRGQ